MAASQITGGAGKTGTVQSGLFAPSRFAPSRFAYVRVPMLPTCY
jgi:hypothetical protein